MFRYFVSLGAIVGAYLAYTAIFVPIIEPNVKRSHVEGPGGPIIHAKRNYSKLFPAGSWELGDDIKEIATDQGRILFQEWSETENGLLEVSPVTVITHVSKKDEQPLVIQVPEGAILRFEKRFTSSFGDLGDLQEALLRNKVTIFRLATSASNDYLELQTSNVQITPTRIATLHSVEFLYGQHWGSGNKLTIKLAPKREGTSKNRPSSSGVRSLELEKIQHLTFVPSPKTAQQLIPKSLKKAGITPEPSHIIVTCNGPFEFDFENPKASFRDEVQVTHRFHPSDLRRLDDRLNCDLLEVFFTQNEAQDPAKTSNSDAAASDPKRAGKTEEKRETSLGDIAPERLIAHGSPAVLSAPSRGEAIIRGERLEYDLIRQRINVKDSKQAQLAQDLYEIRAPQLTYFIQEDNSLGDAWATGPGYITQRTDAKGHSFFASWQKELLIQLDPNQGRKAISMYRGSQIVVDKQHEFKANELHLWINEIPASAPSNAVNTPNAASITSIPSQPADASSMLGSHKWVIEPSKLLADGNVEVRSPQMTGQTNRLKAYWSRASERDVPNNSMVSGSNGNPVQPRNVANRGPENRLSNLTGSEAHQAPKQTFDFRGDTVNAQLLLRGKKTELGELSIDGDVRIVETKTEKLGELPLDIRGEQLQIKPVGNDLFHLVVAGNLPQNQLASVQGRGLGLTGPLIHLDQQKNRVYIDGAGELLLTDAKQVGQDFRQPTNGQLQTGQTKVTFKKGLVFGGQQGQVEGDVEANGIRRLKSGDLLYSQTLSQTLHLTLTQPIDFRQMERSKSQASPELHTITLDGGVSIFNKTYDSRGVLTTRDHIETKDMSVEHTTGNMIAAGPGVVESTHLGGAKFLQPSQPGQIVDKNQDRLTYVKVNFAQKITGNLFDKIIRFENDVHAIVGPVENWDQALNITDTSKLGKDDAIIQCQQMKIAEIGPQINDRPSIEFQALGNTHIFGKSFEAMGSRVVYNQATDKIVLHGNPRTHAELWRQKSEGGQRDHASAKTITFHRTENRVQVDGVDSINLGTTTSSARLPGLDR